MTLGDQSLHHHQPDFSVKSKNSTQLHAQNEKGYQVTKQKWETEAIPEQ